MSGHVEMVSVGPGKGWPRVEGRCPACGARSLFIGSGGYVTCAIIGCSDPGAASDLLDKDVIDEHARLEADLAALREAAQAVVDALNFYDSTLTTAYRNEQRPHVLEAARALRAVLASADSDSRETP